MISGGSAVIANCQVCGATPAIQVRLINHRGYVLMWRNWVQRATVCRDCGISLFRTVQNGDLTLGWWGIISFFLNTVAVLNNLVMWFRLRRLAEPMRTGAAQPLPPGRPIFLRPGAWITAAGLVVAAVLIGTSIGRDDLSTFSASDRTLIGTCVENVGSTGSQPASCSGAHSGKIVGLTHSQSGCDSGQVSIDLGDGAYACSDTSQ